MVTGAVTVIALIFFIFFVFYKKDMLIKMFSLNAALPANQFQQQLEDTANQVIKRLEDQISHLEFLLQEADEKIAVLDERLQNAEVFLQAKNEPVPKLQSAAVETDKLLETGTVLVEPKQQLDTIKKSHEKELVNDKHRLILAMAEQGYNVTEIAKATGVGKGEVMLLLQLHKK